MFNSIEELQIALDLGTHIETYLAFTCSLDWHGYSPTNGKINYVRVRGCGPVFLSSDNRILTYKDLSDTLIDTISIIKHGYGSCPITNFDYFPRNIRTLALREVDLSGFKNVKIKVFYSIQLIDTTNTNLECFLIDECEEYFFENTGLKHLPKMNTKAKTVYLKHEPYLKDLVGCPQKSHILEVGHCGIESLNGAPSFLEEVPTLYDNENLPFEEALGYSERIIQDRSVSLVNGHYKITRKGT